MSGTEYWIDGYNVIGRRRWTESMTLEQAREKLVRGLVPIGDPVRVWFDASKPGAPQSGTANSPDPRVRLVFVRGQTADDAIVAALRTAKAGSVTVVTDDRELRGRARQLGANTVGVDRFLERLDVANAPPGPKPAPRQEAPKVTGEKPGSLSKKDVEEWMRIFGFDGDEASGGLPRDL